MSKERPDFQQPDATSAEYAVPDGASLPAGRLPSLEGILEQILAESEPNRPVSARDQTIRTALIQVARDHSAEPFSLDPVLSSLVHVITVQLQGLSPQQRQAVDRSVAATLYEDTAARERIEKLWTRLVRLPHDVK